MKTLTPLERAQLAVWLANMAHYLIAGTEPKVDSDVAHDLMHVGLCVLGEAEETLEQATAEVTAKARGVFVLAISPLSTDAMVTPDIVSAAHIPISEKDAQRIRTSRPPTYNLARWVSACAEIDLDCIT